MDTKKHTNWNAAIPGSTESFVVSLLSAYFVLGVWQLASSIKGQPASLGILYVTLAGFIAFNVILSLGAPIPHLIARACVITISAAPLVYLVFRHHPAA